MSQSGGVRSFVLWAWARGTRGKRVTGAGQLQPRTFEDAGDRASRIAPARQRHRNLLVSPWPLAPGVMSLLGLPCALALQHETNCCLFLAEAAAVRVRVERRRALRVPYAFPYRGGFARQPGDAHRAIVCSLAGPPPRCLQSARPCAHLPETFNPNPYLHRPRCQSS